MKLPETVGDLATMLSCDPDDRTAIQNWVSTDPEIPVSLMFALIYQGYKFPNEIRLTK